MTEDLFAVLGFERRPWLDPETVKERFHARSRTLHPDQAAGDGAEFAQLNLAHTTLREPKARLRHLLELEFPQMNLSGPAAVPAGLADRFVGVHGVLREADAVLAKKLAAPSSLAKALLAREELAVRERVEAALADMSVLLAAGEDELKDCDSRWLSGSSGSADALIGSYRRFAYLSRWIEQLRERLFQLGL